MNTALFFPFQEALLTAVGTTLLHAVWQGTAIALLLWFVLRRFSTAPVRYRLAYSALLMQGVASVYTFCRLFEGPPPVRLTEGTALENNTPTTAITPALSPGLDLTQWLMSHAEIIAVLWLAGFGVALTRLTAGVWWLHRLRTRRAIGVAARWQNCANVLSRQLGMTRGIAVLESVYVQVPMAMGWFKPVVLLPFGLVNQLTPAEVEAVLAHELAHIARRDWVFNLIQSFLESVFYFHPAVWWIGGVIRQERENCCDDTAVALTGNTLAYAQALVRLQTALPPAFALAFSGRRRKPALLARIRRLANASPSNHTITTMEKIMASGLLLLLLSLLAWRTDIPAVNVAVAKAGFQWPLDAAPAAITTVVEADTTPPAPPALPVNRRTITHDDGEQVVRVTTENDKIVALEVNGEKIPPEKFGQFKRLTDKLLKSVPPVPPPPPLMEDGQDPAPAPAPPPPPPGGTAVMHSRDETGNVVLKMSGPGGEQEIVVKNGEVWINGQKAAEGEVVSLPGLYSGSTAPLYSGTAVPAESYVRRQYSQVERQHREAALQRRETERHMRMAEAERRRAETEMKRAEMEIQRMEMEHRNALVAAEQAFSDAQRTQNAIRRALVQDGLISPPAEGDDGDFTFELSKKFVKVNGKKLTDEIHRRYLELYKKYTGRAFPDGVMRME